MSAEDDISKQPLENRNKISDFSIDAILNSSGKSHPNPNAQIVSTTPNSSVYCSPNSENMPRVYNGETEKPSISSDLYPWLRCNRFRPPKLPRRRDFKRRNHIGRSPRIPFTSSQVAVLEEKFRQTRYLSGAEVTEVADLLHLTEARVKIWFQNRRARERRESQAMAEPVLQLPVETTIQQQFPGAFQSMTITYEPSNPENVVAPRTNFRGQLVDQNSVRQSVSVLQNLHLPFLLYDK